MPHNNRKIRKKRGSRTQGYGRIGQHRSRGCKGFRNPGRHKQGWSYILRYEPDYYGKKGFTSPKSKGLKENIVNVEDLDEIAQIFAKKNKKDLTLDLTNLGYTKLLGKGRIRLPLMVNISSYSNNAAEKIKEAGGQILSKDQGNGE
jgi:large subunit ribosomal protein L15